jgi:hypothetical protein
MKARSSVLLVFIAILASSIQGCSGNASLMKNPTPMTGSTPTLARSRTPSSSVPQVTLLAATKNPRPTESYQDWPIVILESFNTDYGGWSTGKRDDGNAAVEVSIAEGKYLVKVTSRKPGIWCSLTQGQSFSNFFYSIMIERRIAPEKSDYGLAFRAGRTDFYFYNINAQAQEYMVGKYSKNAMEQILPWRHSDHIDPLGVNHIGVLALGSRFFLMANGEDIDSFEDATLEKGEVGVAFQLYEPQAYMVLAFDDAAVLAPVE